LWRSTQQAGRRYLRIWQLPDRETEVTTLEELIALHPESAELLEEMRADGVMLDPAEDYVYLVTTNSDVAKKYDMHEETEFLGDDD
jgi:hypothetical protein